jgi:putative acetyltransferase
MEVRAEKPEDTVAIRLVNIAAFGRKSEADLVDLLRGSISTFSFIAVESHPKSQKIIGHIFFSPVKIEGDRTEDIRILGLAPVAVLPDYQHRGIGSLLIRHGLPECARLNFKAVVVLGSLKYYSRFGFICAKKKGLRCEYNESDEAFMVLELESGALEGCVGTVKYRSEFNSLE